MYIAQFPILIYSTAHYNITYTLLPCFRRAAYRRSHALQGINSCRVPIYYTWVERERIADKMPCLRAHTLSGIRTNDPLIMSREHEPLHQIALTHNFTGKPNKVLSIFIKSKLLGTLIQWHFVIINTLDPLKFLRYTCTW